MVDRGEHTTAEERTIAITNAQNAINNCGDPCETLNALREKLRDAQNSRVRDTDRYPFRYNAEVGGTFHGASGTFTCAFSIKAETNACTVQNRGTQFHFVGPWEFRPSSATTGVRVPDTEFMWFGWWSRQALAAPGSFQFRANHGCGYEDCMVTSVAAVSGTFTYRGSAIGQYAIYQPLGGQSGHGSFNADAVLTANFDSTTVSGTISNFRDRPDWELTLKPGTIVGGAVVGPAENTGVSWSIGSTAHDAGTWEADFYSNLPGTDRTGVVPYGIAGTFTANFGEVGVGADTDVVAMMIGAFGAHSR